MLRVAMSWLWWIVNKLKRIREERGMFHDCLVRFVELVNLAQKHKK